MKRNLAALLSIGILLTGCRGKTDDTPETAGQETTAQETDRQSEETPVTLPPETEPEPPETEPSLTEPLPDIPQTEPGEMYIRLLSGEENFTCSTVTIPGEYRRCWEYDENYMLYMTYTPVMDETGFCTAYRDKHLYMVDLTSGTITADVVWGGDAMWDSMLGNMIYHYRLDEETGIAYADDPLIVEYTPGGISFISATSTVSYPPVLEISPYPKWEESIVSPAGGYRILQTIDDASGSGGLDLQYPDLTTVRLFENILLDDTLPGGKKAGIGDVRVYAPVGFVDDTRFVYRIGGWEWTVGYGIWDLVTGQYTETTGYGIRGVHNGYLYLTENTSYDQYRITAIYKATPEGEETLIASDKKEDGVFWMENTEEYYTCPGYMAPYWTTSAAVDGLTSENPETWSAPDSAEQITVWAPDLDTELAVLEKTNGGEWYICGSHITYVTPPGTMPAETDTEDPVDTVQQPEAQEGEPYIRLLTTEEQFTVSMVSLPENGWQNGWEYDDSHMLWLTCDRITGEHNETLGYENRRLSMLDLEAGEITAVLTLDGDGILNEVTWDGNGMILYNLVLDETAQTYTAEGALRITYTDGVLSAEPTEIMPFPMVTKQIRSPDGQYFVQQVVENGWNGGGMDLVYPDGSSLRLFENVMFDDILPDGSKAGIEDVRGYTPIGFLDDTRFVYTIGGWEHCRGYGVWDLMTGIYEEFTEDVEYVYSVHNGHIYLTSEERFEGGIHTKVWKVTPEGERTLLASDDGTSAFPLDQLYDPLYCADSYWIYTTDESLFSASIAGKGKPKTYQVWSSDMDKILAEFELDGWTRNRVYFCGNQITYVP